MEAGEFPWLPRCQPAPALSVIEEYRACGDWIRSERFARQLAAHGAESQVLWSPLFDWHGSPEELLTLLVQRQFLCLEAFICGAVRRRLIFGERQSDELYRKLRQYADDPFAIPISRGDDSGTVARLFHHLPRLLHPELTLCSDAEYWRKLKAVYRAVRNPIMHGEKLKSRLPSTVFSVLDVLDEAFAWIEQWDVPLPAIPSELIVKTSKDGTAYRFALRSGEPRKRDLGD